MSCLLLYMPGFVAEARIGVLGEGLRSGDGVRNCRMLGGIGDVH